MNETALDQTPIEALQVSMQTISSLKRSQINTIADLLHYSEEDLKLLDESAGKEVIQALSEQFDLTLPENDQQ